MFLPVDELPMFAFPHDLRLLCVQSQSYPSPEIFTFVYTDARGHLLHAACLKFFEPVEESMLLHLMSRLYGQHEVR